MPGQLLKTHPNRLLEYHLVHMFLCLEGNVLVLPMLFDRWSGTGRKQNRSRDHEQEECREISDPMHLIHMTHFCCNDPGIDEILQPPDK